MEVELSWVAPGQASSYLVSAADSNGLAGHWSNLGGGVLGLGNGSGAVFGATETWTTVKVSSCAGDTQASDPTCSTTPTLQPNVQLGLSEVSAEWTNLLYVPTGKGPSGTLTYLNSDLATSTSIESTSGACLTTACSKQAAPPQAPGCVAQSTCNQEYFPAGYGSPVGYHTLETVAFEGCATTPTAAQLGTNGVFQPLTQFVSNAEYASSTQGPIYDLGSQTSTGVTGSGAPIGSTQTVRACNGNICDPAQTITVESCCVPIAQCEYQVTCGVIADGCGGTLNCSPPPAGNGSACAAGQSCVGGYCQDPPGQLQCEQSGGTWVVVNGHGRCIHQPPPKCGDVDC
jgi:hypothetical protein